jgi:ADP-L-glycero-D-manno-heptose 6-epimerase
MKILITGNKGFIGSNAVKHFESNHTIDCYEWSTEKPVISNYDWVLHFGAISSTTERDVEKIMRQNLDFSCWLLNECNRTGANLQYSSSASVYGITTKFTETSPVQPQSPYAWSKYLFERYVKQTKWDITVQGFRYFNVYGPGEDHKGNQASPYHQFTQQAKNNGVIKLFENSNRYIRDFVPVSSIIDIHEQFLTIPTSGVWNIGTGAPKSFLDVANEVIKKHPATIEYIPMPPLLKQSYQSYTCADLTSLYETLNENSICKWHV